MPPADPAGDDAVAEDAIRISRARVTHRHRPDRGAAALGASALVIAAAALALYVAWPQLRPQLENMRQAARRRDPEISPDYRLSTRRRPSPDEMPEPEPAVIKESKPVPRPTAQPEAEVESRPAPPPRADPTPEPRPRPSPEPRPTPMPAPMPAPPQPEPATVDVEKVRGLVDAAVKKAYDALRQQDCAAAKHELAAVAEQAADVQQATDRLQQWQLLSMYAGEYPGYREQALASAAATAGTYDFGTWQIGVVELNARDFIYRDSRRPGRNLTVPRDAIPADVEAGLVEHWFAKDGRAANHLFLGAAAVARREPDLGKARREWRAAADGGEPHGSLLLDILDDPIVRGR